MLDSKIRSRYVVMTTGRGNCLPALADCLGFEGAADGATPGFSFLPQLHEFFSYLVDHFTPSSHHESEYELRCYAVLA